MWHLGGAFEHKLEFERTNLQKFKLIDKLRKAF